MKISRTLLTSAILLGNCGLAIGAQATKHATQTQYSHTQIAHALDWVHTGGSCNLCSGYFKEPHNLITHKKPLPYQKLSTTITAQGPTTFRPNGVSVLIKNVRVTQPGRIIKADKAYIYRDPKTGKVIEIRLFGHVSLAEFGRRIVGPYAIYKLKTGEIWFGHSMYHVAEQSVLQHQKKGAQALVYDAWGVAKHIYRASTHTLYLWDSTYSTCSPLSPTWKIDSKRLKLDKLKGVGTAHDATLRIHNFPIFYLPYYSFPIDNQRKTGFLSPMISLRSRSGVVLSIPYYWNMAPNYDMTLTPELMTSRGILMQSLFRYLTTHNQGSLFVGFIPFDQKFKRFKAQQLAQPMSRIPAQYFTDLRKDSTTRAYFSWQNLSHFWHYWNLAANLNYVTDPYYFRDFGGEFSTINANQLLNQISLGFTSPHWHITGMLQTFQTLHLITEALSGAAASQYSRLPEFDATATYPNLLWGLNFGLTAQAVNFVYHSKYSPFTFQRPVGQRAHIRPSISRPFVFGSGYITPQLALDSTHYSAKLATKAANMTRPRFDGSRTEPIFNVDSGLYFSRTMHIHHHAYVQTLEPRLFYLYVPFTAQSQFPMFDTQVLPFTYDQLFALNRFSGFDRLENANQLSLGITSRIIDGTNGNQIAKAQLGMAYYFTNPKVTIPDPRGPKYPAFNPFAGPVSPLVGAITFYPAAHWSVLGSIALDLLHGKTTRNHLVNNASATITYTAPHNHIFSIGYTFTQNFDGIPVQGLDNNEKSSLVHVGVAWPLAKRWSAMAYWYYNVVQNYSENVYVGVEYSTCCWAIRVLGSRTFIGTLNNSTNTGSTNQFDTGVYVQFLLKGLGSVGSGNPNRLLTSTLPGFNDPFQNQ